MSQKPATERGVAQGNQQSEELSFPDRSVHMTEYPTPLITPAQGLGNGTILPF